MRRRHPLPRLWLLTDERQGDALWPALRTLPHGSGVIFRHYNLDASARHEMFGEIRRIARSRRLTLLLSGTRQQARRWRADGYYAAPRQPAGQNLIYAATAHDLHEIRRAERSGADLLLLSPLFATRSHPGAYSLGTLRFAALVQTTRLPVIALGGVKARHKRRIAATGAYGWAGIDAFIRSEADDQNLKAVPT